MPVLRQERVGERLQHRDSRLEGGAPVICRSVDIGDQPGKGEHVRSVRLEYAYDSDGYLCVEIAATLAGPDKLTWPHPFFRVRDVRVPYDQKLSQIAGQLGFKPKRLGVLIRSQSGPHPEIRRAAAS